MKSDCCWNIRLSDNGNVGLTAVRRTIGEANYSNSPVKRYTEEVHV